MTDTPDPVTDVTEAAEADQVAQRQTLGDAVSDEPMTATIEASEADVAEQRQEP